ncbi:hypothetical protein [Kitasatospora sp. McL0602]|uniref:hypothetical protein n=1 Tax=Kitasatospora sp. McL0602 TaxID=3439530 RepID=UPI003F89B6FE
MSIMYTSTSWPVTPGLPYFRSATWGDGLLIPLASALLLNLVRTLSGSRAEWKISAVCSVGGLLVGGMLTWFWLRDRSPALNWTLPGPGRLNSAGIYHAVFLAVCSALLAGLSGLLFVRLRRLGRTMPGAADRIVTSPAWVGLLACLLGFAGLVVTDSRQATGAASLSSLGALSLAVLAALVCLRVVSRVGTRSIVASTALAVVMSAPLLIASSYRGPLDGNAGPLLGIAVGCAVAFSSAYPGPADRGRRPWGVLEFLGALSTFGGLAVAPTVHRGASPIEIGLMLIGTAVNLALLRGLTVMLQARQTGIPGQGNWRTTVEIAAPAWALMALAVGSAWFAQENRLTSNSGALVMLLISLAIVNIISPILQRSYDRFVKAEEKATRWGPTSEEQKFFGRRVALNTTGTAFAGVGCLLLVTFSVAEKKGFQRGVDHATVWPFLVVAAGVALSLVGGAARYGRRPERSRGVVQAASAVAATGWSVALLSEVELSGLRWAAVPIVALVGTWTTESIRSNGRLLQRQDVTWGQSLAAASVGLASASSVLWAVTSGLRWRDQPANIYWSALGLAVPLLVTFAMAVAVTSAFPEPPTTGGTNYGPSAGVQQDQAMIGLLVLVLVWIPALLVAHVPRNASERWLQIPQIAFGFMLLFTAIFCWILRYNTRHSAFRRHQLVAPDEPWPDREKYPLIHAARIPGAMRNIVRRRAPATDEEWVVALDDHVTLQNLIALTVVVVCVIGWIPLAKEFKLSAPK